MLVGLVSIAPAQNADDFPVPATYKTEGIPPIKKSEVEHLFYDPFSIRSNLIYGRRPAKSQNARYRRN
jgi:hypothetical protein